MNTGYIQLLNISSDRKPFLQTFRSKQSQTLMPLLQSHFTHPHISSWLPSFAKSKQLSTDFGKKKKITSFEIGSLNTFRVIHSFSRNNNKKGKREPFPFPGVSSRSLDAG
ncbi:hypothetical protein CDAR_201391 [Caerostris darwini]|uniref:Uncharacterized protein n=1 Tax=Caerostris darwini TaxID=1538125 RepID=A0AAV4RXF3_9ARAC|nr:hypothetical protein CDAR_201391 [Caerostris darwini]